jgi:uncharacterized repeat protein (TIGR03943 family)
MYNLFSYLVIAAFGWYGLKLFFLDELVLYIHERYELFVLFGAIVCFIIGIMGIVITCFRLMRRLFQKHKDEKHFHRPRLLSTIIMYIPLIAFLGFGLLLPPRTLSYTSVEQRTDVSPNLHPNVPFPKAEKRTLPAQPIEYNFNDWIYVLASEPDQSAHIGKLVKLEGFLFRLENYPEGTYYFYRYVIYHCLIDARPYGFRIVYNGEQTFQQDEWVELSGTFNLMTDPIDGTDVLTIEADSIEKKQQPKNPYLYPAVYSSE